MASGTSPSVSKQHGPIPGPMAARMFSGFAPKKRSMAAMVLAAMPRAVPRQPAWAAPMQRLTGS